MFSANTTQVSSGDTGPYYLWESGSNNYGQAGVGIYSNAGSLTLTGFPMNGVSYVARNTGFTTAFIKQDGSLWTAGDNNQYNRGMGAFTSNLPEVTKVGTDTDWATVASYADSSTGAGLAVKTDGTLWGWGSGTNWINGSATASALASPTKVGLLTNWSKVATQGIVAHAIKTDGTLWGWGYNGDGTVGNGNRLNISSPVQIGALTTWADVSSGGGAAIAAAIKTDGTLWTWGSGSSGGLGTGNLISRSSPVQVGALTDWSKVFCNRNYAAAIKTDNTLWVWGVNQYGQLGDGTKINKSSPVQIASNVAWVTFTGEYTTLFIKTTGEMFAFGLNDTYQMLDGTTVNKSSPVQIASGVAPISVIQSSLSYPKYTRGYAWVITKTDGTCSGSNPSIPTGRYNAISASALVPASITLTQEWTNVAAGSGNGGTNVLGVKTDGTLWSWGYNNEGQLGLGDLNQRSYPTQIGALTNWKQVSTGTRSSGAVKTDGTLWVWGDNTASQLGGAAGTKTSSPVQLGALTNWASICVGDANADLSIGWMLAVKTDGTLWAWGNNTSGKLGTSNRTNYSSPKQVGALTDWKTVYTGTTNFTTAIKTDGTLWAWGDNTYGALGQSNTIHRSSPVQIAGSWTKVACGLDFVIGLKTDGTLWGWGYNANGYLGLGTVVNYSSPVQIGALTDWVDVACTTYGAQAIRSNGTLWSWGTYPMNGGIYATSSPVQVASGATTGTTGWKKVVAANGGVFSMQLRTT
jgi:alpha-tubulin suppressor-like RCC1 family protein